MNKFEWFAALVEGIVAIYYAMTGVHRTTIQKLLVNLDGLLCLSG